MIDCSVEIIRPVICDPSELCLASRQKKLRREAHVYSTWSEQYLLKIPTVTHEGITCGMRGVSKVRLGNLPDIV